MDLEAAPSGNRGLSPMSQCCCKFRTAISISVRKTIAMPTPLILLYHFFGGLLHKLLLNLGMPTRFAARLFQPLE